jgi:predicted Zn-ribbon and HTH transcriptional regulator
MQQSKDFQRKFQRKVEDFLCENCGFEVVGNGYTNHCPKCLWSKHVDINPGDRAAKCGGLMKPISIEQVGGLKGGSNIGSVILHKCVKCGYERKNKVCKEDDFEAVLRVVRGGL